MLWGNGGNNKRGVEDEEEVLIREELWVNNKIVNILSY